MYFYSILAHKYEMHINHFPYSIRDELLFDIGRFMEFNILKIMIENIRLTIEIHTYEKFQYSI